MTTAGFREERSSPSRSSRFWLLLLGSIALLLRLHGLESKALWADEMCRVTWSKGYEFDRVFGVYARETAGRLPPRPAFEAVKVASGHNPPLYALLINGWFQVAGDGGDFVARLPSAVLSAGAVLVTFFALRRRFGERAALFAAAFTAMSPFQVFYAQEANHYALAYFFISLSFLFYFRFLDRRARGDGVLWALASVAALYSHYYCGFVTLFQWASLVWPYRLSWKAHLPPALLVGAGFAPYLPEVKRQLPELTTVANAGDFLGAPYFVRSVRTHLLQPYLGQLAEAAGWLPAILLVALSVALAGVAFRRLSRADGFGLLVNLIGPVVVIYSLYWLFRTNTILWSRYQIFFGFAFTALVGVALSSFGTWARSCSAAMLCLFAWGNLHQWSLVREDWRTAAALVDAAGAPNEPVFVYRSNLTYSLARYLRGENRFYGVEPAEDLEALLGAVLDLDPGGGGSWYASAWPERNDVDRRVRTYLSATHERCEPQPVDRGWVSMSLIRCTGRRPPPAAAALAAGNPQEPRWRVPHPGPRLEAAWLDTQNRSSATGWVWSTAGLRAVRVVLDGTTIAEFPHPGIERSDVSAAFPSAPREYTLRSGFRVAIRASDGEIRRASLFGVRADGTLLEIPPH